MGSLSLPALQTALTAKSKLGGGVSRDQGCWGAGDDRPDLVAWGAAVWAKLVESNMPDLDQQGRGGRVVFLQ